MRATGPVDRKMPPFAANMVVAQTPSAVNGGTQQVNRQKVVGKVGKFNICFRQEQLSSHAGTVLLHDFAQRLGVARMQARLRATESLDEIPKVQRHPVPQSLQAFAEAYGDRHTVMAAAYVFGAYTLKAIAAYFGVHSSTGSGVVRRAEGQQPAYHQCMIARPDPISDPISPAIANSPIPN
jgi:hypothetical protein